MYDFKSKISILFYCKIKRLKLQGAYSAATPPQKSTQKYYDSFFRFLVSQSFEMEPYIWSVSERNT